MAKSKKPKAKSLKQLLKEQEIKSTRHKGPGGTETTHRGKKIK